MLNVIAFVIKRKKKQIYADKAVTPVISLWLLCFDAFDSTCPNLFCTSVDLNLHSFLFYNSAIFICTSFIDEVALLITEIILLSIVF